jgi:hypothetical protein
LVNSAISNSGIAFYPGPNGIHQARRGGADGAPKTTPNPDAKVTKLVFNNAPVTLVLNELLLFSGKTLVIPLELLDGPGLNLNLANLPSRQGAAILRDALRLQSGLLLDESPDGAFHARRDESFIADERVLGAIYLQNVTANDILGALHNLSMKQGARPQLDADQSLITVGFSYRTKQEAGETLRAALASQAGILMDQQADGTWEVRPSGRNEHLATPAAAPKSLD